MIYTVPALQGCPTASTRVSLDSDNLSRCLALFLEGDPSAREVLPQLLLGRLLYRLRVKAAYLDPDLYDDVEQRTWELLLLKPASSFDPKRASASTFLRPIVQTAVRDVRASYAPPGCRTRPQHKKGENGELKKDEWEDYTPALSLNDLETDAHGDTPLERIPDPADDIERLHRILNAEQLLDMAYNTGPRKLYEALDFAYRRNTTSEIAAESVGTSRFAFRRMLKTWVREQQRQGHLNPKDWN